MLHCTPCDDDPGKDSTLLIAFVLHKQSCIQCYNYNQDQHALGALKQVQNKCEEGRYNHGIPHINCLHQ